MWSIKIKEGKETTRGRLYDVTLHREGGRKKKYSVEVDEKYYRKVAGGTYLMPEFVRKTFKYVTDREDERGFLKKKKLKLDNMKEFFPKYEEEIMK